MMLPEAVLREVFAHARETFPAECCGWLTDAGVRRCENRQLVGGNPVAPERGAETAYVIDGDDLKAFLRGFKDGPTPRVVYHSHPNGRAYFSATDKQVAAPWGDAPSYDVHQLVVGIDATRVVEAALFAWSDDACDFVEVARYPGAQL